MEFTANDRELLFDHIEAAEALLDEARAEIDRWGHGDFHYGPMPRDEGVLTMLAKIDAHRAEYPRSSVGEVVS